MFSLNDSYMKLLYSKILIFSILLLLLLTKHLSAQTESTTNVEEAVLSTSDRTYLSFGQGFGNYKTPYGKTRLSPLIFEGQISPDFFMSISKKRNIGLAFFPKIVVRMFNENSFPVKTPSYMPSLLFYHELNWPFTKKVFHIFKAEQQRAFLTYRLSHHSNGQQGDFYTPDTDSVNFINGNFSTNAFEMAFTWSVIDSGITGKAFTNGRIAYERQLNFEREPLLKNTYYFNKLSLESHIIFLEKIKAYITYSFMWGTPAFTPQHAIDLFIVVKPFKKLSDFSVFVRGYMGPDYYNIYYVNKLRAITLGIIADPLIIPMLKKEKKNTINK
jgi:hypothetical protein